MKVDYEKLLKDLRSELVGKLHTQPFTIYTDKTIQDLIKAQPKTLAELEKVKGFPPKGKRIKGFGEAVIAIFNNKPVTKFEVKGSGSKAEVITHTEKMNVF